MQEKRFQKQITWMMFLFSILVIWVHSYNIELFAGGEVGPAWNRVAQIEKFWSVGLGQTAVPGFFLVSSYLYFRNFKLSKLAEKWKRRCFSIVIPYVVWNLVYYFGYIIATRLPMVQSIVGKSPIPFTMEEIWNAVLHYSYAPVFWYLYQLMLLLILSPVIYLLVKNKWVGILYLIALLVWIGYGLDIEYLNADALLYFSFSAFAAVHWKSWMESDGNKDRFVTGIGILIIAVYCYGMIQEQKASVLWTIFYRMLSPISLWMMLSSVELPKIRPWMRQSFFLYAIHFMIVRFINKGMAMAMLRLVQKEIIANTVLPKAALMIYLFLPAAVLCLSYQAARFLMRFCPPLWNLLSGGRKLETE